MTFFINVKGCQLLNGIDFEDLFFKTCKFIWVQNHIKTTPAAGVILDDAVVKSLFVRLPHSFWKTKLWWWAEIFSKFGKVLILEHIWIDNCLNMLKTSGLQPKYQTVIFNKKISRSIQSVRYAHNYSLLNLIYIYIHTAVIVFIIFDLIFSHIPDSQQQSMPIVFGLTGRHPDMWI